MTRFTEKNLRNIELLFESKTGVDLHPKHQIAKPKWVLAAALVCCLVLTSCGHVLFSSLNKDPLALRGSYEKGVVSVLVVNGSEKPLRFQERVKLMSWQKGEIPAGPGTVRFENTEFPPHSSGTMIIDLTEAYPTAALEAQSSPNDLYLILTNNDFAFGQDWRCHFDIGSTSAETLPPASPAQKVPAHSTEGIDPTLQFYFEDHYLDQAPAFNTANGAYMAAVQELLSQQEGVQVHSMDPLLLPDAVTRDSSLLLNYHSLDSFNRMVGSVFPGDGLDSALMLKVALPQYKGQVDGGIGDFKLLYYFTFPTEELKQPDAYAFVYGRVLSFPEMEDWKVYSDTEYTVYDLTDLFYTDLDAYLDDFLTAYGGDVYVDENIRQQVRAIYDRYHSREDLDFRYLLP